MRIDSFVELWQVALVRLIDFPLKLRGRTEEGEGEGARSIAFTMCALPPVAASRTFGVLHPPLRILHHRLRHTRAGRRIAKCESDKKNPSCISGSRGNSSMTCVWRAFSFHQHPEDMEWKVSLAAGEEEGTKWEGGSWLSVVKGE